MKKFVITVPIAGSMSVFVEASSIEEVEYNKWHFINMVDWPTMLNGDGNYAIINELEAYEQLVNGYFFSGPQEKIEIKEIKNDKSSI